MNSSSETLNSSIITYFERSMSTNYAYKTYLLPISEVDNRDGVPLQILNADIVIVTDPDQIHLEAKDQKMINYINKMFINNEEIATNFEMINKMKLDDMDVYFYKKNKEFTDSEKEQFHINANEMLNK